MTELQTRKPTGTISFPFILIEGEPKGGKTYALAALSNSPRVGRTFALELGESTLDEYATLGPFEIIVHDGTFSSIRDQLKAAMAVPMEPDRPNVIGIDSGSHLWGLLKDWTDARARRSRAGVAKLREDPDAEIDASMNLWNDAKDRWHEVMDALMAWPGIAVVTARGAEKAKVVNGNPVAGQTEYTVEAEKTLVFDVTAQVRFERGKKPRLMAVKSLFLDVPTGGFELPRENTLDHLVFDILAGGRQFTPSTIVLPQLGVTVAFAKFRVLQAVQRAHPDLSESDAKAEAGRIWKAAFPTDPKEVTEAVMADVLARIGTPPDKDPGAQEKPQEGRPGAATGDGGQSPPAPTPSAQEPEGDRPRTLSPDEVVAKVRKMQKKEVVDELTKIPLPTSGKLADLQDRLLAHLGVLDAPFDTPTPSAPDAGEPGGPSEGQAPTDGHDEDPPEAAEETEPEDLPEVRDVPAGWVERKCLCDAPIMYEPGNVTATIQHLDPRLDEDHRADELF